MKTTLNEIRKHKPCADGWEKLLTYLGKTKADDEPLSITTILDSNGPEDALWCLRAVEGKDREIRLFAVWCARQVQHLLKDQRSIDALDVAERYAKGQATEDELNAAWNAALAAAWDARSAASAMWAAWAAAYAARAAADAAWVARAAADAAEGEAAAAAYYATLADAEADEWEAAWAAEAEMKKKQEAELRRICEEIGG